MMKHSTSPILQHYIETEINRKGLILNDHDNMILKEMLIEVNAISGSYYNFLSELVFFGVENTGSIYAKYLPRFNSFDTRGHLIPYIVRDRVLGYERLILDQYLQLKESEFYFLSDKHSYPLLAIDCDNAFRKMKPSIVKADLLELVKNPLDAYYLPLTLKKVSSWRIPEMERVLWNYVTGEYELDNYCDFSDKAEKDKKISFVKRQLTFGGLGGLKYYPSERSIALLTGFENGADKDLSRTAAKSIAYINKRSKKD